MTTLKSEIRNPKSEILLRYFALALVLTTFCLLALGGTVTSKGVGLAVPDWPRTYGHNMFTYPVSGWTGGVFWEHTHRLLGAVVGMLAIVMAVWLWVTQGARPWLRWFGVATLLLIIIQGVMGGFRVTFVGSFPRLATPFAILHGVTGQIVLCATVLIAAATGRVWQRASGEPRRVVAPSSSVPRVLTFTLLAVLLVQLILGASMRHTDSSLAIPDFPASYGRLLPPLSQASLDRATLDIPYDQAPAQAVTIAQVAVHFAHRAWAMAVLAAAAVLMTVLSRRYPRERTLTGPMLALAALLIAQVTLGALVIWTGQHPRNPEFATAHQATGAAILATAALLAIRVHLLPPPPPEGRPVPQERQAGANRMEPARA